MKYFRIILLLFLPIAPSIAQISQINSSEYLTEFRGIKWGSTIEDVRSSETSQYLQKFKGFGIEAISFSSEIAGLDVRIDYTFRFRKLVEGSYTVKSDKNYREDFMLLLKFVTDRYGNPNYRSGPIYSTGDFWLKENNYGMFKGPSLYWKFENGFIALLSEKLDDNITISILYVNGKTIKEYATGNIVEIKEK